MNLEKYPSKANKAKTTFTFISEGNKGSIIKLISYTEVEFHGIQNVYNLGFGDLNEETGEVDDLIVSNNQDREKILATVAHTVLVFTNQYPDYFVIFEGSSPVRTRLYQMAISKYFDELSELFDIVGFTKAGIFLFDKNMSYDTFLISRKIS
jgi:hypothetical protein